MNQSGERMHTCSECGKQFKYSNNLQPGDDVQVSTPCPFCDTQQIFKLRSDVRKVEVYKGREGSSMRPQPKKVAPSKRCPTQCDRCKEIFDYPYGPVKTEDDLVVRTTCLYCEALLRIDLKPYVRQRDGDEEAGSFELECPEPVPSQVED